MKTLSEELENYKNILAEAHPLAWPEEEMQKARRAYGIEPEVHGLARYPEFKSAAFDIVRKTAKEINQAASNIDSKMPYKEQFLLEEIIKLLKELV